MAKEMRDGPGYATGRDAAYIKPKFVPNEQLRARDDSGGPDFEPYSAEFGDGGEVTGGSKSHLSARGGDDTGEGRGGEQASRRERETEGKMGERNRVSRR